MIPARVRRTVLLKLYRPAPERGSSHVLAMDSDPGRESVRTERETNIDG
jgi:hypothetical protein